MTMMIWWQNTHQPATCSIQGSLTLGLEEAVEENHHMQVTDSCQSKSINLQKCPQGNKTCMFKYKYFKTVLEYKYKYQVCI